MANKHFANLGDVWKHLPLGEILVIEAPARYVETHAGSATYSLEPSRWEREYGAGFFLEHCGESSILAATRYAGFLRDLMNPELDHPVYPGSPYLALSLLAHAETHFVFCDLDPESLDNIRSAAGKLGVGSDALECVHGDGIEAAERVVAALQPADRRSTFVHIDGYSPFDSLEGGLSCIEIFSRLAGQGVRTLLWYGFHTDTGGGHVSRADCHRGIRECLDRAGPAGSGEGAPWCDEVWIAAMEHRDFDVDPGVHGCGILAANLQPLSCERCTGLAEELARIYHGSELPHGWSGALKFEMTRFR